MIRGPQHSKSLSYCAALLLFGAFATAAPGAPPAAPPGPPDGAIAKDKPLAGLDSILNELRKGGFVIYLRHAATVQVGAADETADLTRCETQRNLSAEGREQAVQMGKAVKALGIPVGTVLASPFCRTKDTAQLAFGRFTVNKDLYFAISTDARETKRLANALRQMLSTLPARGTNTVLVAHTANLREAAGIFPKPEGAAYVFQPLPDGRFEVLARILPEEWAKAVKREGSPASR